jgi:general secretion pathway protein N
MRLDDVSPRTWLLGTVAGWALLAWVLALVGMGGRVSPLPEDSSLLQSLPKPTKAPPERLGPFGQYAEIASRPLFSDDRRPQPFSLGGDDADQGNDFDYILTSVLLVPQVKLAMIQPTGGGEPLRIKLGDSVEPAPAWRLVALNPRSAVFEGPGGQKTLELRVFNGQGGEPPTPVVEAEPPANAMPVRPQQAPIVVPPPGPQAIAGGRGASKPDASPKRDPDNVQQQMDDLRSRIEQRRAQLRADEIRELGGTPPPSPPPSPPPPPAKP